MSEPSSSNFSDYNPKHMKSNQADAINQPQPGDSGIQVLGFDESNEVKLGETKKGAFVLESDEDED